MKNILATIMKYREERGWTESQQKLLERWARLSDEQQKIIFALIDKM